LPGWSKGELPMRLAQRPKPDPMRGVPLGRFEAATAARGAGEDQVLTVVAALQVRAPHELGQMQ
jgi:hypothetical protein